MNQREQSLAVRSRLRAQELDRRLAQRTAITIASTRILNIRESIRAGMYDDDTMLEMALEKMMARD